MRLKCGSIIRTLLLIVLLYLIFIISKDDQESNSVKDAILDQLPSNQRRGQYIKDRELEDWIKDQQAEQNINNVLEIRRSGTANKFGKVAIENPRFDGREVDFVHDQRNSPTKEVGKVPEFNKIDENLKLLDNSHQGYDPINDPLKGTVGSLIYVNNSVPEAYYTSSLGNYELPDPCENSWKNNNDGQCGNKITLNAEEEKQVGPIIKKFGFNLIASDKIPMDRDPKDLRKSECKHWHYPETKFLPKVIVILVFYNEGWGPLMRTVHTVIKQTPKDLLSHIVMVDDASPRSHLHERLEIYIRELWGDNGIVRLYRNARREGLIRARINGAKHAMKLDGDILVYLDAHCEPQPNWLPPLITPIARDRRITTVPLIDSVNGNDYTFSSQGGGDQNGHARGAWDWSMLWKRMPLNEAERRRHQYVTEPYASPAMAGGLFAIDKNYFKDIGFYDPGLEIWGGENFEISYKVWMCHGQVLFVPCSRVGHIYRMEGWGGNPPPEYVPSNPSLRNYIRVVEVWWDEYKEYFYTTRPETTNLKYGDISEQKQFRVDNKCKSFQWFLDTVAPDLLPNFPLPPLNIRWGELRLYNTNKCLDGMGRKNGNGRIATYGCHGQGGNQLFRLTEGYQLAQYDSCVTFMDKRGSWVGWIVFFILVYCRLK